MKRKVIQVGEFTKVVSLPREWIKKYDVKKGDELFVTEHGSNISIAPNNEEHVVRGEIDLSGLNKCVDRVLNVYFKGGYDELKIKYDDPKLFEEIPPSLKKYMIGFEMIEQGQNYCVIKSMTKTYSEDFDSILLRTLLLLNSMSEGIKEAIANKDLSTINNIKSLEETNNRYTGFCSRLINKDALKYGSNKNFMYTIVEELEKIADVYKYICCYLYENPETVKEIDKRTAALYSVTGELLVDFINLFKSYNIKRVPQIFQRRKEIISEANDIIKKKSGANARIAYYLMDITQMITNITSLKIGTEI